MAINSYIEEYEKQIKYEINEIKSYNDFKNDYLEDDKYAIKMSKSLGKDFMNKYISLNIFIQNNTCKKNINIISTYDANRIKQYIKDNNIDKCICSHPIEKYYLIYNIVNKNVYIVGSHCINKFKIEQVCRFCIIKMKNRKYDNKDIYKTICNKCKTTLSNMEAIKLELINHDLTRNKDVLVNRLYENMKIYRQLNKECLPQIKSRNMPQLEQMKALRIPYNIITILRRKEYKYKRYHNIINWSLDNRNDIRKNIEIVRLIKYLSKN